MLRGESTDYILPKERVWPYREFPKPQVEFVADLARVVPGIGEVFREIARSVIDFGRELDRMERGVHCGPRQDRQRLTERREWRRCKRYWTQTKKPILARGERY